MRGNVLGFLETKVEYTVWLCMQLDNLSKCVSERWLFVKVSLLIASGYMEVRR